jgi:hypothetical protein
MSEIRTTYTPCVRTIQALACLVPEHPAAIEYRAAQEAKGADLMAYATVITGYEAVVISESEIQRTADDGRKYWDSWGSDFPYTKHCDDYQTAEKLASKEAKRLSR